MSTRFPLCVWSISTCSESSTATTTTWLLAPGFTEIGPYWLVMEMTAPGLTVKRNSFRTSAEAQIAVARTTTETSCARRVLSINSPLIDCCAYEPPCGSANCFLPQLGQGTVQSHLIDGRALLISVHHDLLSFLIIGISLRGFLGIFNVRIHILQVGSILRLHGWRPRSHGGQQLVVLTIIYIGRLLTIRQDGY